MSDIEAIRQRVEACEQATGTADWVTAKCRLELRAAADLRFLLDYIDKHEFGSICQGGQFALGIEPPPQPIVIEVRGGIVQDVLNVPEGLEYEVTDYDDMEARGGCELRNPADA